MTSAEPIARSAPRRPTRSRVRPRSAIGRRLTVGDQQRDLVGGREDQRLRGDLERPCRLAPLHPDRPVAIGPPPGRCRVPRPGGRSRSRGSRRSPRLARDRRPACRPPAPRQGPPRPRDRRGWPRIRRRCRRRPDRTASEKGTARPTIVTASPGSSRASRYDRRPSESPTPASGDHSAGARTRSSSAAATARSSSATWVGPAAAEVEPGRLVAQRPGLALEAQRGVEPRAAREDAQAARRVTHPEADRPFLDVAAIPGSPLTRVADGRPVVDAGHALEQRDEGHLGGLDPSAHADLAGGHRSDRGGRRVGHPDLRAVALEAPIEQDETRHDAERGQGRDAGRAQRVHRPIVRDGPVSSNGAAAAGRRRRAGSRPRWRRSATTARGRRPGRAGG